jgi:hypothetical protein
MIELDLPWTVDADESRTKTEACILTSDREGGIPFTVSYNVNDSEDEERARQLALVICRRFNADLPDEKVRFWLFVCTRAEGWPSRYTPIPGIEPQLIDLKRAQCDQRESTAVRDYLLRRAAAAGFLKAEVVWKDYADMEWTGDPEPKA